MDTTIIVPYHRVHTLELSISVTFEFRHYGYAAAGRPHAAVGVWLVAVRAFTGLQVVENGASVSIDIRTDTQIPTQPPYTIMSKQLLRPILRV